MTNDSTPSDKEIIQAADKLYGRDGELEFDDDAKVSKGDDPGAYVQCWRWIYFADIPGYSAPADAGEHS